MASGRPFRFGGAVNWFPGHMAKAVRTMQERVRRTDVVLEVRDARVRGSRRRALGNRRGAQSPQLV
jgi:ribosome biogenesis GTPase A